MRCKPSETKAASKMEKGRVASHLVKMDRGYLSHASEAQVVNVKSALGPWGSYSIYTHFHSHDNLHKNE